MSCPYICPHINEIIDNCDVLVDGKFELDYLDLKLKFSSSANQRVIDLKKTIQSNEIVWALEPEDGIDKYIRSKKIVDTLKSYVIITV